MIRYLNKNSNFCAIPKIFSFLFSKNSIEKISSKSINYGDLIIFFFYFKTDFFFQILTKLSFKTLAFGGPSDVPVSCVSGQHDINI